MLNRFRIFFLVFFIIGTCFSATWYVNATLDTSCNTAAQPHTNDHSIIQDAINAATAGDTIIVCRNGSVTLNQPNTTVIDKALNIYGNQTDTIVNITVTGSERNIFNITSNDVNISNFTLRDATGSFAAAIATADVTRLNVSRNNFVNNEYGFWLVHSASQFVVISENNFTSPPASSTAIYFAGSQNSNIPHRIYSNVLTGDQSFGSGLTYGIDIGTIGYNAQFANNTIRNFTHGIRSSVNGQVNNLSISDVIDGRIVGSNVLYNNSVGIYLSDLVQNENITIANNIITNHTGAAHRFGIYIGDTNFTKVENNSIFNNEYGIYTNRTFFVNISNNTLEGNTFSVFLNNSHSTTILFNSIYNSTNYSIYLINSNSTNLTSNTVKNTTIGIYFNYSSLANMSHNTVFEIQRGEGYGIFIANASNSNDLWNNSAYDNSVAGFAFSASVGNNLTGNNASNNTYVAYHFISGANATFTGTNFALLTPSSGLDLNVTGGGVVTTLVDSSYNTINTSYMTIFFSNAQNVSIKTMNLTDGSATTNVCSAFSGSCTLVTFNNNVVNVTNNSAGALMDIGIYYNTAAGGVPGNIYVAKYSGGWQKVGQTAIDGTVGTIRYDSLTDFASPTFGVVNFHPHSTSSGTSQTSSPPPVEEEEEPLPPPEEPPVEIPPEEEPAPEPPPEEESPVVSSPEPSGTSTFPSSEPDPELEAREELVEAQIAINIAESRGKDASRAQATLSAARRSFINGEYGEALELAQEAIQLARNSLESQRPPLVVSVIDGGSDRTILHTIAQTAQSTQVFPFLIIVGFIIGIFVYTKWRRGNALRYQFKDELEKARFRKERRKSEKQP